MEHSRQREEQTQRTYVRNKEQKEPHPVALGMKPVGRGRGETRRVGRTARARPCAQGPGVFLMAALEGFKQESNRTWFTYRKVTSWRRPDCRGGTARAETTVQVRGSSGLGEDANGGDDGGEKCCSALQGEWKGCSGVEEGRREDLG